MKWRARLARLRAERRERGECDALLYHGPGHQSTTWCRIRGPHKIHEARYGGGGLALWRRKSACTGFFDDPPPFRELRTDTGESRDG